MNRVLSVAFFGFIFMLGMLRRRLMVEADTKYGDLSNRNYLGQYRTAENYSLLPITV